MKYIVIQKFKLEIIKYHNWGQINLQSVLLEMDPRYINKHILKPITLNSFIPAFQTQLTNQILNRFL